MSSTVVPRSLQAPAVSTSGRNLPTTALPRFAAGAHRFGGCFGRTSTNMRTLMRVHAEKEERKAEKPPAPGESTEVSPFLEPLLRGLVLGIGSGILCEMAHVAFKVTNIATDGGSHWPSAAQLYEQLKPLFVWDHAVAISFWLLFYMIEAVAILAILRKYPDDQQQASRVIRSTPTLPKRLMPLQMSALKKAAFALINGRSPQSASPLAHPSASAPSANSPSAFRGSGGGTTVLERPTTTTPTTPTPTSSRDATSAAAPTAEPLQRLRPEKREQDSEERNKEAKPAKAAPARGGSLSSELRRAAGLKPGQLDPTSPLLGGKKSKAPVDRCAKREKELADRRAYLQNFWYAAALSEKVTSKPIKVDILSRTVTIWRGEDGKVHCLDNVCPHRGAPLSGGWTKTKNGHSCVVCPYHGWAFNGQGALEEVPSQGPEVAFPRRPLVDAYPVEERGGFVWLFFGAKGLPADERPPLPLVPELEDPNWRAVYGEMEFDCPHWSVFENALDMAHIHYLHNGSFGNQDNPVINDMTVTRDTWSVGAKFSIHNKPVNPLWNFSSVPAVPVEARALLPSTSYVKITLGGGIQMITYVNTVPIDEHRAINRFCLIRNFALQPVFDGYTRKSMFRILGEDKAMIELLKPEQLRAEVSLEADKPQIAFRQLRQEWIDMGYGVQPEAIVRHGGSLRVDM